MTTNATYTYEGAGVPALLSLEKNRVEIRLVQTGAVVYWYYDLMVREDRQRFSYSGGPEQGLYVQDATLADELTARIQKGVRSASRGRGSTLVKVLLVILVLLVLTYFLVLPRVAAGMVNQFPVEQEKALGDQMYQSLKGTLTIDAQKTAYANDFFRQMKVASPYDIQITVVKGDVANAFAMPGGHIVVYDKILKGMSSYHDLAALLAHEFSHVQHRHSLRSLFRSLSAQLFLSLIVGDIGVISSVLVSNAEQLKSLSYSRELETEADEQGSRMLAERKMDCNGFVRLFTQLKKEGGEVQVSEWMNSHPDLDKRIKNIQQHQWCNAHTIATDGVLQELFQQLKRP